MIVQAQDGVRLLKAVHRLCNQQYGCSTGLMDIVMFEHRLTLNLQGRRSKLKYLRAFRAMAKTINMAGGYSGGSIAAAKLVVKEKHLEYKTLEGVKQAVLMKEASKRYLAALTFTSRNSEKHTQLKSDVKHDWVRNNTSNPRT